MVDLDTVMPGSSLYDFGDAIRFGAATRPEDTTDLAHMKLDLALFEAVSYTHLVGKSRGLERIPGGSSGIGGSRAAVFHISGCGRIYI